MMSKQTLLGVGMMAFGGVLLFALAKQPSKDDAASTSDVPVTVKPVATTAPKEDEIARPQSVPLTADVETEARILEQKQKEREARVAQQERQARELLANQEKARAAAMAKTAAETEAYEAARANKLKVQNRPESAELAKQQIQDEVNKQSDTKAAADKKAQDSKAEQEKAEKAKAQKAQADKAKAEAAKKTGEATNEKAAAEKTAKQAVNGKHTVTTGDTLIRLSHQYGVPVSILAEANNMGRHDNLPRGKVLKIPTASEAKKIEAEIKAKAQKAEQEKAQKAQADKAKAEKAQADKEKADAAKKAQAKADTKPAESKGSAVKGSYVVQVALAADQARADQMAAQYKAAGYKVTTSQTSRGVRVMIGAESTREAADALRDKLKKDGAVNAGNAWVMQAK